LRFEKFNPEHSKEEVKAEYDYEELNDEHAQPLKYLKSREVVQNLHADSAALFRVKLHRHQLSRSIAATNSVP
jgi:hypothetical protein